MEGTGRPDSSVMCLRGAPASVVDLQRSDTAGGRKCQANRATAFSARQPKAHALYRRRMNCIDLHNKLRQGVCCMADVWSTI
eukprot:6079593-Pleurochrysis_carterae.AAC.1